MAGTLIKYKQQKIFSMRIWKLNNHESNKKAMKFLGEQNIQMPKLWHQRTATKFKARQKSS